MSTIEASLNPSEIKQDTARRVIFVLLSQLQLLDLAGPAQVFDTATRLGADYQLLFCGMNEKVDSAQGLQLAQLTPLPLVKPTLKDIVIVPGVSSEAKLLLQPLLDVTTINWLQKAYKLGVSVASVCTGAFALGEAGLLKGRRCTTHWRHLELLQKLYPQAQVLDNRLFVYDNNLTTSAGLASGIDMAFSIIEKDYGAIFTAQLARQMVIYLRRNGFQPQQSIYLEYRQHLHSGVHQAQDFIVEHLNEKIGLAQIAQVAGLSSRSLNRAFKEATSLTPIQYQQYLRLELARGLMADVQFTIEEIATKCGFEDARHFRRLWKARYGMTPSYLRQNY